MLTFAIYIYIIISTYELDDMYLPPVFRTRAGGSETFGLVRVVFEKVFAQDDSVVVLVSEHREYYIYIYVFISLLYILILKSIYVSEVYVKYIHIIL